MDRGQPKCLAIAFQNPGHRYGLEILAWPFVVPDQLSEQSLVITVDGFQVGKFFVGPGEKLLECGISSELTQSGNAVIVFDIPNAERPSRITASPENRTLGLAFKRLKLLRYLERPIEFANNDLPAPT